ncbi:hypothetical protein QYE76_059210 [Lolium multiflorum]|uniref:Plant heme peroxidase family profile domain-containing protein n=1 Tax=Lolium multiflorum TaxID=4521 RepID=A0AAD8QID4_LOLMU|nr:hypothetical protein QYE76_059210 [Lolium multiflorum]
MQPPKQKRKLSTPASIKALKRPSALKRPKTPDLLPYENTDEQTDAVAAAELKAFLAPKKPAPKLFIASNTIKHFAETRQKKAELSSDYDRFLGQSSRARKATKIAQLGQQENQSLPPFVVQSYDDPETTSIIERAARDHGADVQYADYYPMAEVVNKYRYGHDLVKPGQVTSLGTQMRRLYTWHLQAYRNSDRYLTVAVRDEHYFRGKEEINLEFEELFQSLDKSIISCYCIMKMFERKRGKLYELGFIDPNTVHEVTVRRDWKRFINTVPGKWKSELTFKDFSTADTFDNAYYQNLVGQRGLLHSDQELFNGGSQDALVRQYSNTSSRFSADFATAMVKMGNLLPTSGTQEIRVNCKEPN